MIAKRSERILKHAIFVAPVVLLSLLSAGCAPSAANEPARAAAAQRAYIASSCPSLKEQPPDAVPVGILLEVADLVEPTGAPLKDWLSTHPVEVHHVAKISLPATSSAATQSPFGTCLDRACSQTQDATLAVAVTSAPTSATAPLQLQLTLSSGNRAPDHLTIKTTDQEPVSGSLATSPEQTVVVTPYYLFEPKQQSMGKLLQCASQAPKVMNSN